MTYDVLIIGGGPGGIYTAWELLNKRPDLKLALFESGHTLERRRCPIDGVKVKSCVHCPTCAIMNGFGGATIYLSLLYVSIFYEVGTIKMFALIHES